MTSFPAPTAIDHPAAAVRPAAIARPVQKPKTVRNSVFVAGILCLAVSGGYLYWKARPTAAKFASDAFYTVQPMELQVTVSKDGELAAVNNTDINCPLEGQSTIKTIVKEGSYVKKGELLITMDGSEIEKKLKEAQVNVEKAESDVTNAKEAVTIQEAKNATDLAGAEVELELAKLDQREYDEGKYPAALREAEKGVRMAAITLRKKREELVQARQLNAKGFMTNSEVDAADLAVVTAENDYDKKQADLDVLINFTHEKETKDKANKVAQAEGKLARTKTENAASLNGKKADLRAKEQTLRIGKNQAEKYQKQFDACIIKAPSDGLPIYGSSVRESWWRDRPISAGATVREQELLIRLPDTSKMKVQAKVPESLVSKIRVDEKQKMPATVQITGYPKPLTGWVSNISVLADNSQRWWNPDLKEYPVEITLDQTPEGIKPGTSASVTIDVERLPSTLAVPMGALYSVGKTTYVFRHEANDVKPQVVTLGQMNATHAQILEGIHQGDQVLLLQAGQGREFLEKAGIKTDVASAPGATTQPTAIPAKPAESKPAEAKPAAPAVVSGKA